MRFAVIGAGMAGILSAIKLTEAGFDEVTVYEKRERLGGTWNDNTYPGLACDVPSHLYSYSFAPNPEWSHHYSPGEEIRGYFEKVAGDHDIERMIRYGDEVVRAEYDDGRWHIETASGHTDTVDVVIAATGVLHHPRYPDIEGLDTFAGDRFHSARWDHDVDLTGKRVGVIGTGSTAVQIVSALVDEVAHLDMYQRTAQWILSLENPEYGEEEKQAFRDDPESMHKLHEELSDMFGNFANAVIDADSAHIKLIAAMCLENLEDNVHDDELRERLRPDYRAGCKRLVVSPTFYGAIQKPNVDLVTSGIERAEPEGIRTEDGELHELDVLVLATGFHVDAFMRPMVVTGRNGVKLDEVWADRPLAYMSISIPEFPNLFMLNGPNGPVGNFSLIEVSEYQFAYIEQLIECLTEGGAKEVCATREATDAFEAERVEAAQDTIWVTGCNSWYLDDRGVPAAWPWPFQHFRDIMQTPDMSAYELR
ncbi:MAG: NAD(P)/FAD-dependent oxidoreductase [Actinomycetia bacterium]|nr:NAD(P)/FAD-dependent oxidoreductase [Actinomycetes bacterium]